MELKEKPYVLDRYDLGINYHALHVAIEKQTGVGQMPAGFGQFGWFATDDFPTLCWDCGCGRLESCDSPTVYYVLHYSDGSFSFIVDEDCDPVVCSFQTLLLQGGIEGSKTVTDYLNLKDAEALAELAVLDRQIDPLVARLDHAVLTGQFAQAAGLFFQGVEPFVQRRIKARMMLKHTLPAKWEQSQARHRARKYLDLIDDDHTDETILMAMAADGADAGVVALIKQVLTNRAEGPMDEFPEFEIEIEYADDDGQMGNDFPFPHIPGKSDIIH